MSQNNPPQTIKELLNLTTMTREEIKQEIANFIMENIMIGVEADGLSITVRLFMDGEKISEATDTLMIYQWDIKG